MAVTAEMLRGVTATTDTLWNRPDSGQYNASVAVEEKKGNRVMKQSNGVAAIRYDRIEAVPRCQSLALIDGRSRMCIIKFFDHTSQ